MSLGDPKKRVAKKLGFGQPFVKTSAKNDRYRPAYTDPFEKSCPKSGFSQPKN